ncbi:MAG TPA: Nif11-like leader peptide family natural product precursor [Allosphingosinicella sp.]|jgi:hypothetical protein
MGSGNDDSTNDPHGKAGQQAYEGAGKAVPPDAGADLSDDLNNQMLKVKRAVADSPELQARLSEAQTQDEFHDKIVEIGAEHGVTFTPAHSKSFLAKRATLLGDEPPPPPPPPNTSQGYTCDSANWCTWNVFRGC